MSKSLGTSLDPSDVERLDQTFSADAPAGERLKPRRDRLGHRVDRVGAHRVTAVNQQVRDDHRPRGRVEHPDFNAATAAAELHQHRVLLVGERDNFVGRRLDCSLRTERVVEVDQLDLPNHHRVVGLRRNAGRQRAFRHVARCGDNRRLLQRHRHEQLFAVDLEVGGDTERQREAADDVLNHTVGSLAAERTEPSQCRCFLVAEAGKIADDLQPLRRREFVETGDGRGARHACGLSPTKRGLGLPAEPYLTFLSKKHKHFSQPRFG